MSKYKKKIKIPKDTDFSSQKEKLAALAQIIPEEPLPKPESGPLPKEGSPTPPQTSGSIAKATEGGLQLLFALKKAKPLTESEKLSIKAPADQIEESLPQELRQTVGKYAAPVMLILVIFLICFERKTELLKPKENETKPETPAESITPPPVTQPNPMNNCL